MVPPHPTGRWTLPPPGAGMEAVFLADSSAPTRTGDGGRLALQNTTESVCSSSRQGLEKFFTRCSLPR